MLKIPVAVKKDFLESLSSVRPLAAVEELIWNGFDASSNHVQVHFDMNELGALQKIRVRDYGQGINYSQIKEFFGNLGESWKKHQTSQNGRALHGKNGKGRFKVFALGTLVEWNTTFLDSEGHLKNYSIIGNAEMLDGFSISEPVTKESTETGTEVIISNLKHNFISLKQDKIYEELAKSFAVYLLEYPELVLEYDGVAVNPKQVQILYNNYNLDNIKLDDECKCLVSLVIIEWKMAVDRVLNLCDNNGTTLHKIQLQIKAPGFDFTAYVKSDYFREAAEKDQLILAELLPNTKLIINAAKDKIKEHFRCRILEDQCKTIVRWKSEQIYPYEEKTYLDALEIAERQVFDIIAVNVESYLPSFENADITSKRFTFRLLAQAIRENPNSVQKIITEILGLKKDAQDDLAELLQKTDISSIISSAKTVANRLDFLIGLENLLFDKETKKKLLERDQLHKIIEKEAWLFDERFTLAGSEQRLEEVLQKHLEKLGEREDSVDPVMLSDGKTGRIDLMLHKTIQPRDGEYDYLIIELKRPSKKIDSDVLTQIKKYARAVAADERFQGIPTNWTFWAVSNELDDFAKREANQRNWPKGKVSDDADLNITVWAMTWAEIINNARARLSFFNKQLAYEADRDSAKAYLIKAHSKFIPRLSGNSYDMELPCEDEAGLANKTCEQPQTRETEKL